MISENEIKKVINWLNCRLVDSKQNGFVIGISGGIDSAVVSALCAETDKSTMVISLPIHQCQTQIDQASDHVTWLLERYSNVVSYYLDLTEAFESLKDSIRLCLNYDLVLANMRSRLRMTTLYAYANSFGCLVVGTGNKIEDFGIGFFTKYGDGGVDISPIGDFMKSEVYDIARYFEIIPSIQQAKPTDGLWGDNRTDEDQIGDTYVNLEKAMLFCEKLKIETVQHYEELKKLGFIELVDVEEKTLYNYLKRHENNLHKMVMPLICNYN
jgi:NAD+ synthase